MVSEIKVDTISEKTSANGVSIDGAVIKDGKVTGGAAGLTLISSAAVSASNSITLDGVFTSTFKNYLLTFNGQTNESTAEDIRLQMRASSSTDTTANMTYAAQTPYKEGSSSTGAQTDIASAYIAMLGSWFNANPCNLMVNFLEPQVSGKNTGFHWNIHAGYTSGAHGASVVSSIGAGHKAETTSFDGFIIFLDGSQTFTGDYRLYGYN
tara:strand:- start:2116 stop:2742 length:627 start_codon:yes stop_codon:yes gene_type:complete